MKRLITLALTGLALTTLTPRPATAAELPKVIRLAFPGAGTGNRPVIGGTALSTVQLQGLLEEEFKAEGVKLEWFHFRQAGPAINEAFANGLLDFAYEGDLAMIIGRAGGLETRVLAASGLYPVAVAVPSDSPIKSLADLKGKRVVISKGTALQLAAARVLARVGLTEKDLRVINIVGPGTTDVLATKDADAVISIPSGFYGLRDRGIARIIFESDEPDLAIWGGFVGLEGFIQKYPDVTKRIVKAFVKAARFNSLEQNRSEVFKLWGKDGTGFGYYKESYVAKQTQAPIPLASRQTPLLDEYWLGKFKSGVADAQKYRLIRKPFDVDQWIDRRFLDEAIKELGLEKAWVANRADGKPAI